MFQRVCSRTYHIHILLTSREFKKQKLLQNFQKSCQKNKKHKIQFYILGSVRLFYLSVEDDEKKETKLKSKNDVQTEITIRRKLKKKQIF